MTGKLKNQLDLDFGQPKWFLSAKAQYDWQVKKKKKRKKKKKTT
jgi:hypothetical protein